MMDEYSKEERFEELKKLVYDPVKQFHRIYKESIPMSAGIDGYYDDNDVEIPVASYYEIEDGMINVEETSEKTAEGLASGSIYVRNNIFKDLNQAEPKTSIQRVMIDFNDGFVQSSVLTGPTLNENQIDPSFIKQDGKEKIIMGTGIFANTVNDIAFSRNGMGSANLFFGEREDLASHFQDTAIEGVQAIHVDKAVNPNLMGIKTAIRDKFAFNNIIDYCNLTGLFLPNIAAMVEACVYLSHEVLNLLLPQAIVLVIDSASGCIDIPRKDYIPTIADPVLNLPDYDNKIRHIIYLMKTIANKKVFSRSFGNFYLKLSISAPCTVIAFLCEMAPNIKLVLPVSTIDNQILHDCEVMKGFYPRRYIENGVWNDGRNTCEYDIDLLRAIHNDYMGSLISGETNCIMNTYNNYMPDQVNQF